MDKGLLMITALMLSTLLLTQKSNVEELEATVTQIIKDAATVSFC